MLNLKQKTHEQLSVLWFCLKSLVVRDLRIYAVIIDGKVFRCKDKNSLEIDTVIQLNDGRRGAMQIKIGSHLFDGAAAKLINFADKVNQVTMVKPSFLAIISATEYGYIRDDGVYVIPIGCLRE